MNLPTIVVGIILLAVLTAVVIHLVRKHKAGGCGCSCAGCPGGCGCSAVSEKKR